MYQLTGISLAMNQARSTRSRRLIPQRILGGAKNYKFQLPPNIPATMLWSLLGYDTQTLSEFQTDQPFPSANKILAGVKENSAARSTSTLVRKNRQEETRTGFKLYLERVGSGGSACTPTWFEKRWRPGEIEVVK